jgi:AcrR family transcriptional regulator
VYVYSMETPQLGPEDWLDLALEELKARGHDALKAQPLAQKLKVTRGSFYHHFESLESFHAAVIRHWAQQSSGKIIQAARETSDARQALDDLLQKTFRSGEALERAVRAWSTVKPLVAHAVAEIDHERIAVAETLLVAQGVPPSEARPRARLLYWAAIGRLMMPFPAEHILSESEISGLARLVLGNRA